MGEGVLTQPAGRGRQRAPGQQGDEQRDEQRKVEDDLPASAHGSLLSDLSLSAHPRGRPCHRRRRPLYSFEGLLEGLPLRPAGTRAEARRQERAIPRPCRDTRSWKERPPPGHRWGGPLRPPRPASPEARAAPPQVSCSSNRAADSSLRLHIPQNRPDVKSRLARVDIPSLLWDNTVARSLLDIAARSVRCRARRACRDARPAVASQRGAKH